MNDEINDPKWEEKLCKKLQEYNNKYHIFKDPEDTKKVRYVIEDTHKIRFFEFADDMIQKDVFNDDITPEVLPKKRGRPRKYPISDDPPKPKNKPGRPMKHFVDVKEGESRKNKVVEKYLKERYHSDEEFKEKIKQISRDNYQKSKEKIKEKRRERYAKSKTDSTSEDTNSNDNDDIEDDVKSESEENKI